MTNQRAFGKIDVGDEQIDVASTFEISNQVLFVSQNDIVRQLAKAPCESDVRN